MMKKGVIIQARMGSTRLSGKVMKQMVGKTVLEHVIERIGQAKLVDEIIIATTIHDRDDIIEQEALRCGAKVFRGSEEDVLSRYYYAAKENNIETVIRVTSDCPLIDPQVLDAMIGHFLNGDYDILTNGGGEPSNRTYPRGLDAEIVPFAILENAFINAKEHYHREHVMPYVYENTDKICYYKNNADYSQHRWTLDTPEDFELINTIYEHLYKGKHDFYMNEILQLFDHEPQLFEINAHIVQKKVK